ncbi:hypothetical protein MBLNU459_g2396t1 [Dothideomycetes sp. NU459]
MDVSWDTQALLSRFASLPPELVHALQSHDDARYLAEISRAALDRRYTDLLVVNAESLIPHYCASFSDSHDYVSVLAAFGRILAFAPHAAEYAERYLAAFTFSEPSEARLEDYLLGLHRLLQFDHQTFAKFVPFAQVQQTLLEHDRLSVRYLAIRLLCLYLHAADAAMERMISRFVGDRAADGPWEDRQIDYRFLTLWEEQRTKHIKKEQKLARQSRSAGSQSQQRLLQHNLLHPLTACISGVLLPRNTAATHRDSALPIVDTPTTFDNLRHLAQALTTPQPILLTGLAGSGKTLLVRHAARELDKLKSMVTLHLNEQSDAKLLIGMYTTGHTPGSFTWQPGVLTTAVLEGRWVFIEDLDRAPNEIISTLLPLIERRELVIPSRGQTIHAARGFRIIATMRTAIGSSGQENKPAFNLLGARHWKSVHVHMSSPDELRDIVLGLYPMLREYATQFVTVFERLQQLKQQSHLESRSKTGLMRAVNPRDLFKWCARVSAMLGEKTTLTAIDLDQIFLDAVDCFAGALPEGSAYTALTACIAETLQIDPQRRVHLLDERTIAYKVESSTIRIGRNVFSRLHRKGVAGNTTKRAFSTNAHTLRLLDRIGVAVNQKEPLLLVGETGTGKTTSVQHLAEQLGKKLVPFNLSQQSESGDLLGGFKPINARSLIMPMKDEFDDLFSATFSYKRNVQFLETLGKCMAKQQWIRVCRLWATALDMVEQKRVALLQAGSQSPARKVENPNKKRKVEPAMSAAVNSRWNKFAEGVKSLEHRLSAGQEAFAFSFVEGNIIKAVRNGDWVLLDEINLASPDTLEALADLFDTSSPSILLSEAGSVEVVKAHPQFRVFAAMNPATDVGKKDLPLGIRSRFTELYVESPDRDLQSLQSIVKAYLGDEAALDKAVSTDVCRLHQAIQKLNEQNFLVDGAGQKPHFSLRTLTRALTYAKDVAPLCSLRRALSEGFQMSFLTLLDKESEGRLMPLIQQHLFGQIKNAAAELKKPLRKPANGQEYVRDGQYWLRQGEFLVKDQPQYIITPFIRRNLDNLIRASFTRRFPVLIQGPTSAGKTSMIEYLANRSGNKFVRINNHEHTDLQEYLGTYVSGSDGRLQFQEGVLVKALREGHWIVLDELNLAPTDVLEALNRLLDDNRELLIPETQETVRPHENFMLFATQNPAGLYGGRKVLSRAFRNRFLELHFDDIPVDELHEILHRRTQIPDSWCKKIVTVYRELSILRQENRLFEQKSFATLRDLFRWALREADTIDQLATNGFMLLAERVRKPEERQAVKKVIEKVLSARGPKVVIDEFLLYGETSSALQPYLSKAGSKGVVWTSAMRRLYVLVATAIRNNEPVLLVGETGCGKTTVVQMLADAVAKELHMVNAHQNTETGDLIGAQRPLRNRAAIEQTLRLALSSLPYPAVQVALSDSNIEDVLKIYDKARFDGEDSALATVHQTIEETRPRLKALFEWADGSLVHAMKTGQYFLLDEISLADDSVLERLNSVLEPSRSLLLAEKGSLDSFVTAEPDFQFFATMNPGGDYGKRELSPALRNRFTEIWVPALSDVDDVLQIVRSKLEDHAASFAYVLVEFAQWFNKRYNTSAASSISIRDTLAWIEFINRQPQEDPSFSIVHGAAMVYIDTLGANPAAMLAINPGSVNYERSECLKELSRLMKLDTSAIYSAPIELEVTPSAFTLGPFVLSTVSPGSKPSFTFLAPTTKSNAMRVVRALQLTKPVLLEGNPGVGKTTLVTALAHAIGMPLTRINLSEQTDLMDLFGSDVPVEGASAGTFAWRDAPFLRAMKNGEWVLLDEMNLASQSVLEGLNACLDHRGEVYISELDQTFRRHPNFKLFAAQNPHHQGGGRKGLPASFVNRFTVVYADVFSPEDLIRICQQSFPQFEATNITPVVNFIDRLDIATQQRKLGGLGGPWEFNLRDTLRWLTLVTSDQLLLKGGNVRDFLDTIIAQRFRTQKDRTLVLDLFSNVFNDTPSASSLFLNIGPESFQVGYGLVARDQVSGREGVLAMDRAAVPKNHLRILESIMIAVTKRWPVLLVGSTGSGKTSILENLATLTGATMVTFSMNADIDSMDLVGGYEQSEPQRAVLCFFEKVHAFAKAQLISCLNTVDTSVPIRALHRLLELASGAEQNMSTAASDNSVSEIGRLLQESNYDLEDVRALLEEAASLLSRSTVVQRAQFEWMDGMLVQALERGQWLVLDNANLCSPAVLDRLNSLLEPNGSLIINEHTDATGQARAIKPHPDFRIFFTMDPKYGELSRALRNRAVELFLLPQDPELVNEAAPSISVLPESAMHRLRNAQLLSELDSHDEALPYFANTVADHVSFNDLPLFRAMMQQIDNGLFTIEREALQTSFNKLASMQHMSKPQDFGTQDVVGRVSNFMGVSDFPIVQVSDFTVPFTKSFSLIVDYVTDHNQTYGWYAAAYKVEQDLVAMQQALARVRDRNVPKREQTRLQRSARAASTMNAAKDFTVGVYPWLKDFVDVTKTWMQTLIANQNNIAEFTVDAFEGWRNFWWQLYSLIDAVQVDEAAFNAYLDIGSRFSRHSVDLLPGTQNGAAKRSPYSDIKESFTSSIRSLQKQTELSSGRSMTALWTSMRPQTARTFSHLQDVNALERMADQFDAAAWRFEAPLDHLLRLREAFGKALSLVIKGAEEAPILLTSLKSAMSDMVNREDGMETVPPHFHTHFEGIGQIFELLPEQNLPSAIQSYLTKSSVLALQPTKQASQGQRHDTYQALGHYVGFYGESKRPLALAEDLHAMMLSGVQHTEHVPLSRLDLLRVEVDTLAHLLSSSAHQLELDQINVLDAHLRQLVFNLAHVLVIDTNEAALSEWAEYALADTQTGNGRTNKALQTTNGVTSHVRSIRDCFLSPCVDYIRDTTETKTIAASAKAWLQFALGCVKLYVPNRPFDPALRPLVEKQMFQHAHKVLHTKLAGLHRFYALTGQYSALRVAAIESDLQALGSEPTVPEIARPPHSELPQLQGEFNALLRALGPLLQGQETDLLELATDAVLRQNITQVKIRLSEGYRAYADITAPVVGFLHALEIGFALADLAQRTPDSESSATAVVKKMTPMLGANPGKWLSDSALQVYTDGPKSADSRIHALSAFSVVRGLMPENRIPTSALEGVNDIFDSFYEQWRTELQSNQQDTAAKSSIYRFRGDEDLEDETAQDEYNELFPEYENTEVNGNKEEKPALQRMQGLAPKLADTMHGVCDSGETLDKDLLALVKRSASILNHASRDPTFLDHDRASITPLLVTLLHDKAMHLGGSSFDKQHYNIYNDSNLAEAERLMAVIRPIQVRFKAIQEVWPEHATLADVLRTCDELLAFPHTDPVAKLMTKTEKLHAYVHEWQLVASREYNVAPLYDSITNLIVSWRQLELSTWSRLLDMETEKCENDAKTWFFIAFENIIRVPLSIGITEAEMRAHVTELLKTLESFFLSTGLGQFAARLRMLGDFHKYVKTRAITAPALGIVDAALANFVSYMARFQPLVTDSLVKGRQGLEKNMKDVIQLASWKDTNILALKQSAKASHRKLFRVVRKFRALLGQPAESIIRAGLPDLEFSEVHTASKLHRADVDINPQAVALCNAEVKDWSERPARFRNTVATISVMHSKGQVEPDTLDSAADLNIWLSDVEAQATELRKATPTTLTEENTELVKHLKTRKRKLFADVLRELRSMGFKSNLSSDVLARQDSLQAVLAQIPPLDKAHVSEGYLFRLLHLMPLVRDAFREHSDDLTGAEVARSVALVESTLQVLIQQRTVLGSTADGKRTLNDLIEQVDNLAEHGVSDQNRVHLGSTATSQRYSIRDAIFCLPAIVNASAKIVAAQASLGKLDCEHVVQNLQRWANEIQSIKDKWTKLVRLPIGLTSTLHTKVIEHSRDVLVKFQAELRASVQQHPYLDATLRQVIIWAVPTSDNMELGSTDGLRGTSIAEFSRTVCDFVDAILGSVQDLEKPLSTLPRSTEDVAWLVSQSQGMTLALKSLRLPFVNDRLEQLLQQIQYLEDTPKSLSIAAALLHSFSPILSQYQELISYNSNRLADLHQATSQASFRLAKIFTQLSKQGFCTPPEKSSKQEQGEEKLEGGTGLGEGDGGEDISKDIADDEDLTELAQEKDNREDKDEIEDEKDAVDMADQEMEGEMGDAEEKEDEEGDKDEEGDEKDVEEETGDVDDLGPSTVDEKMWDDGGKDDADKDKEGEDSTGTADKNEVTAADGEDKQQKEEKKEEGEDDEDEAAEEMGAEESEQTGQEEVEKTDPHLQEQDNLDLPDDIDMDGPKSDEEGEGSDMEDMGDVDMDEGQQEDVPETEGEVNEPDRQEDDPGTPDISEDDPTDLDAENQQADEGQDEDQMEKTQDVGEDAEEEPEEDENMLQDNRQDESNAADEVAPSDAQGAGLENEQAQEDQNQANAGAAQQESGTEGAQQDQPPMAGAEGERGQAQSQAAAANEQNTQDSEESLPFKKIGDALEKWYRQQKQIQDARAEKEERRQEQPDIDMADAEFEHLPDEDTTADAQALGAATEDQAKAIDEEMGLPTNENETREDFAPEQQDEGDAYKPEDDIEMRDPETTDKPSTDDIDDVPNAFVGESCDRETTQDNAPDMQYQDEPDVEEVDTQLTSTHLDASAAEEPFLLPIDNARQIYLTHESSTRNLSLVLAEHLRLILSPTQATKMRGDFRTGKRLNIKRIIPYIASQYKCDKIWMRRSVPSKRTYQIMLAIDDSKSMAESGSDGLAFETMALVARALTILEAGELAIVGFGDDVSVAHDFSAQFTTEAGAEVVRRFAFEQTRTNVRRLVETSLQLFRDARLKASAATHELWQLMLVISDGVCEDHPAIRRLVRQAHEERIMIVFVIVDASAGNPSSAAGTGASTPGGASAAAAAGKKKNASILDLQTAEFAKDPVTGEMRVVTTKYLDTFPFGYYLVVRDVLELPGVLAGALRQWFAEVVETA